ncbi:hypothetical protein SEA_WOFFORD_276 [Streptomyces phage Wofford]|uniref:Uncharacterized protein n=1 Tax=Streptomyces phage Wofford TaxID=2283267 RepID=A0A345MA89_9CAUD|nr:hypothetical protein HWB78_gp018 [Streptomyces phage Wollford]YP_009839919.1 hypothetical protein HWB78_gp043 [Streptomyces phage Wollford]AXH67216.1 hypothetical protein SEA_WOFFORD_18 [Streptomyces phage Wollford]AXH67410.1 hypothetical protein SEA_WOFFORD_276 [Streptomyces phage Wollford]
MERIEVVQKVAAYFPDTKIELALRFAGELDRAYNNKFADERYKLEDQKYAYGEEQYKAGVKAGQNSVRGTFDPKMIEVTTWAIMNFTERDYTRKITCIKVLRERFEGLGLLEAKTVVDNITPMGKTDQLDWEKIESVEGMIKPKATPTPKEVFEKSNSSNDRSDICNDCGGCYSCCGGNC